MNLKTRADFRATIGKLVWDKMKAQRFAHLAGSDQKVEHLTEYRQLELARRLTCDCEFCVASFGTNLAKYYDFLTG